MEFLYHEMSLQQQSLLLNLNGNPGHCLQFGTKGGTYLVKLTRSESLWT